MAENSRIAELRRRVQLDPASIAFAALAEEYRRSGRFEEAIDTCIAGLRRHPSYLSAHVTLGRSLLEVGRYDEAQEELEHVLKLAPENLAAIRGLAEIHHRRGDDVDAGAPGPAAPLAPEPAVASAEAPAMNALDALFESHRFVPEPRAVAPASPQESAATVPSPPETTVHFHSEVSADFDLLRDRPGAAQEEAPKYEAISDFTPESSEAGPPAEARPSSVTMVSDAPALAGLEEFLSAILRARANRAPAAR